MDIKLTTATFLAAVTIGLFFMIEYIANQYGPSVRDRFLERGEKYADSDIKKLRPIEARGYAIPVLFPFDLLFMIFLGSFLAMASVGAAESISSLKRFAWLFAVAPALYVAADLFEDVLLARMLLSGAAIEQRTIDLAQNLTKAKCVICTYAILQTIGLAAAALVAR